jgi:glycosyltransferase involved in cell wall biosynthesis
MGLHNHAWRSLVSAYVFVSASQRDLLHGSGLDDGRVFVRHNLVPYRDRPVSDSGLDTERTPSVVYAGRLDEAKGVRLLMAGWDRYLAEGGSTGLRLVIVGGGPLESEVTAWAAGQNSVKVTGPVDGDRCAELISQARAVLLPSVWEETFGLVAIEAMAAGVPPVAAAHGSFPELITPGVNGTLFSPGDPGALAAAIADVGTNPQEFAAYGDQARKTYEHRFDPKRSLDELLEIYRFAIVNRAG